MAYSGIHLQEVFPIDGISTIHHFEYNSDFIFKSEYHDYWTFFFVEDGIFEISQQGRKGEPVSLEKGHLYLQAPEENYSFRSLGEDTALVFTIGFYSKDENLRLLSGRDYFCDQVRLGAAPILKHDVTSELSTDRPEDMIVFSAVAGSFARLFAEKLLLLEGKTLENGGDTRIE